MDLCDLEAVLVYMVNSRLAKTKTWDPVSPPPKKKKKKKKNCMDVREGRVLFIS